jgi:CRP-like cAMP-binding protein
MSLESDIALFKGIPLFGELPTEQLRLIAFSAVRLELAEGQVLFREGTKALSGFVVLSGEVQLTTADAARRKAIADCPPGSLIGEIALFVETKRPATATATAPSQVLEIERKVILRMLSEYPGVAIRMRQTLADRLNATVVELDRVRQILTAPKPIRRAETGAPKK